MTEECERCGDELFDPDFHDLTRLRSGESVYLCDDCRKQVEEEDGVKGRFELKKCPTCGHHQGVTFRKYKPHGRPKGSKTDPVKKAKRLGMVPLEVIAAQPPPVVEREWQCGACGIPVKGQGQTYKGMAVCDRCYETLQATPAPGGVTFEEDAA